MEADRWERGRRLGRRREVEPIDTSLTRPPQAVPPSSWLLPDPTEADADGVVGIGADLEPSTLIDAYRRGIFPWPHPGVPLPWFSPDPRGVLHLDRFHISRSLARTLRRSDWTTTVDHAFGEVVAGCARRPEHIGTWITSTMSNAYQRLHELGWAHSVEVWSRGRLVGGVYGVQLGGVFTGESMFHTEPDASKVALADLCTRFWAAGGRLLDVQLTTPHLRTLGACDLARERFLRQLGIGRDLEVRMTTGSRPVARLPGVLGTGRDAGGRTLERAGWPLASGPAGGAHS